MVLSHHKWWLLNKSSIYLKGGTSYMKPFLSLALSLSFLLLSSVPVVGDTWPVLPDANFLWQNTSNREGNLVDWVTGVTVRDGRVFVVGESETTAGSGAFAVKAYDSKI